MRELEVPYAPSPGQTPSVTPHSPGVSSSAARVPGPTLPDGDVIQLTQWISELANQAFRRMPTSPEPEVSPPVPGQAPSATDRLPQTSSLVLPAVAAPDPGPRSGLAPTQVPAVPSSLPVQERTWVPESTASPFQAPLRFDDSGLFGARPDSQLQIPIIERDRELERAPLAAPQSFAFERYELDTTSVGIRSESPGLFDPQAIRREFPILDQRIHGKRLVWLDNAATTQKPRAVIDRLRRYYETENSNIHRAAHTLAARSTDAYENARETTRRFLGASSKDEIVFVRGATEGINLVAQSWGRRHVQAGDEIVITWLEHHANIVPWQQLCAEKGARLRVAPVDDSGQVILEEYEKLFGPKTRMASITQVSNALGTVTPVAPMVEIAHRYGAKVLVDGAQAVSHMSVNVAALDCDFYAFSGHKVYAPTGIGVVYGKKDLLDSMPPWQGGGNMIEDVTFERTRFHPAPARFEAGTASIGDAVGLGSALDWLMKLGVDNVGQYEHGLLEYGQEKLRTVPGLKLIGTSPNKAGVMSFVLDGQRTQDVGAMLDKEGIAVRSGHHCAQPILRRFGLEATVRASLAPYNACDDIDALVEALHRIQSGRSI